MQRTDDLIPWRVGAWMSFGLLMIWLAASLQTPLPLIPLIGLSYPMERWLRKSDDLGGIK